MERVYSKLLFLKKISKRLESIRTAHKTVKKESSTTREDYLEIILGFSDIDLFMILTSKKEIDKRMNINLVKKIIKFNKEFNNYI